jgi:hypothetical protein
MTRAGGPWRHPGCRTPARPLTLARSRMHGGRVLWRALHGRRGERNIPETRPLLGNCRNWRKLAVKRSVRAVGNGRQCAVAAPESHRFTTESPEIADERPVSSESVLHLIAINYGLALTRSSGARGGLEGVVFRPIAEESGLVPLSAIWSRRNSNPTVKHLLALAKAFAYECSMNQGDARRESRPVIMPCPQP